VRSDPLRLALALSLTAGCAYDWDSLRPNGAVVAPDVVTDAVAEPRVDVPLDRAMPDVATDMSSPDVMALDVLDASDVTDASDVADASDITDVSDVLDASDVRDAADVLDAADVADASDVRDAADVSDVLDVVDVRDVADVPVDMGPPDMGTPCTGPAMLCPCAPMNTGGYCRPGESCTAGRCEPGTVAGSLVITEIMNDPDSVTDEVGEWFEVYNPGATPLDLRTMRISNSRSQSTSVISTSPVVIAPRAYAVLGRNAMTATNGNVTLLYAYGTTVMTNVLTFSNASVDAVILDMGSMATEIDRVLYDGATSSLWPRATGKAKSLRPTALTITDNDMPANWCNAPTQWVSGMGDYGSPGVANPACP
jgi:Lamin Tail Domain